MQTLRLRVKEEITLCYATEVEGVNENLILHKGEEYEVCMCYYNGWPAVKVKDEMYDMVFDEENEFWEFWEYAPMSELMFRQIFDLNNERMQHIKEDIAQGFYSGYYDLATERMLESELDALGYAINGSEYIGVIDYIMLMNNNENDVPYTLKDWLRDTLESQPEMFIR